jgi:hypothetical protein
MHHQLTINDLSINKELDRDELAAVRGGSTFNNSATNVAAALGGSGKCGGIGGAATAVVVAPVTQVDASQKVDTSIQTVNASTVLGNAKAGALMGF